MLVGATCQQEFARFILFKVLRNQERTVIVSSVLSNFKDVVGKEELCTATEFSRFSLLGVV